MTAQLEKVFFNYILKNKKYCSVVEPFFFRNKEIQIVYKVVQKYFKEYPDSDAPSARQLFDMVALDDINGLITKDIFKNILKSDLDKYNESSFIIPKINTWILSNRLKVGATDIVDESRGLDSISDLDTAINIANKFKDIVSNVSSINFIDDDDSLGSDFDEPENHVQDSSKYKVKSGFESIDFMLGGGWDISTLNVVMAETNNGKCSVGETEIDILEKGVEKRVKMVDLFEKVKNSKQIYN